LKVREMFKNQSILHDAHDFSENDTIRKRIKIFWRVREFFKSGNLERLRELERKRVYPFEDCIFKILRLV